MLRALYRTIARWAQLVYAHTQRSLVAERFTLVAASCGPMLQPVRVPVILLESDFRPGRSAFYPFGLDI